MAPSSGVLGGNDVDPGTSNANIDHAGFEEGSGDSEEDGISNFQTDMSRMVKGINMSSSINIKSSGKRKERDPYEVQGRKKKCLELVFSCCQDAINYLRVCRL